MKRTCSGCQRPTNARVVTVPTRVPNVTAALAILTCDFCDRRCCTVCGLPDPSQKRARCGNCGTRIEPLERNAFVTMGLQAWES